MPPATPRRGRLATAATRQKGQARINSVKPVTPKKATFCWHQLHWPTPFCNFLGCVRIVAAASRRTAARPFGGYLRQPKRPSLHLHQGRLPSHVVIQRRDGPFSLGQPRKSVFVSGSCRRPDRRSANSIAAHGSEPLLEAVAVASDVHGTAEISGVPLKAAVGMFRLVELGLGALGLENLLDDLRASRAALIESGRARRLQRHGHAGDAEERPLRWRGHRARVQHVDPGVQPAVDAAEDQIGRTGADLLSRSSRSRRTALHRPNPSADSPQPLSLQNTSLTRQRRQIG